MTTSKQRIQLSAVLPVALSGLRLDQALSQLFPEHSRARIQSWIRAEQVQVDHQYLRSKDKVFAGQHVEIDAVIEAQTAWEPQAIALDIVYEDDSIIVVNKPAGLVIHPAAGNPDRTLVNALLHHDPALTHLPRAGIVHRIDKDTSGLLVVARTLEAHTQLISQIQGRTVKREYAALVNGILITGGTIDAPIDRHPVHRTHMAIVPSGKTAITHYRIFERFRAHTFLQVFLETGRTHQIRVHMAHIGHPLVGDRTYGGRLKIPAESSEALQTALRQFKRQALHARRLTLIHPKTRQEMRWEAPLPDDMRELLQIMRDDVDQHLYSESQTNRLNDSG